MAVCPCECRRDREDALLTVTDSGIGMAADAIPHLFERFYRVHAVGSQGPHGAGLGLALARWIADRHHATIGVTSRPNEGATFVVRVRAIH